MSALDHDNLWLWGEVSGPMAPRRRLNHQPPGGHIGIVPWTILPVGDNLRVAIGSQEIEISTLKELAQVQQLFSALTKALTEVVLR